MRAGARLARVAILAAILTAAGVITIFGDGGARVVARETTAAEATNLKTLMARLQRHYQETESFGASFKQTITRVGAPPKDRDGTVYYERPGRIRFEFSDPQPETIVSDGVLLHDYDPGLNQVMETPLKNVLKTRSAAAFLMGAGDLEREFNAAPGLASADNLQTVQLTPKGGGDRIDLGMDQANFNIVSLQLNDALGNVTLFHFDDIRINVPLEEALFAFKVPAGADIVSPSGPQ